MLSERETYCDFSAKLSIYSSPTPDILLQDTPLPLERQIGAIRQKITGTLRDTHSEVQGFVSRWIAVEHAIESTLSVNNHCNPLKPPNQTSRQTA